MRKIPYGLLAAGIAAVLAFNACKSSRQPDAGLSGDGRPVPCGLPGKELDSVEKIRKSDEEWKQSLTDEQYYVTREKGTERAFTGKYYKHKEDGVYRCSNCGAELFSSETKFESGSGWPSYWAPISQENVHLEEDNSHNMRRTEVQCSRCGAHLGHVFDDGPDPTGKRYCINSASLDFQKRNA